MRSPSWTFIVASAVFAALQTPSAEAIHPTTPFQYWKDACGYPSVIPALYGAQLSRVMEAEALLIRSDQIERRTDDPNFFRFKSTRVNVNWGNTSQPMGGDAPFLGETQMGTAGRSGFLIAPDIIATASHANNFNPYDFVAVFDVRSTPQAGSSPLVCNPPDPEHIPAANVYYPRPANALIANTLLYYYGIYGANTGIDYAAFYLERATTGRRYLRIRKTGTAGTGDHYIIASHPYRLRTKVLYGFDYAGEKQNISFPAFSYPTFNDFYLWEGMSGAAVYNLDRQYVEVSVGGPVGAGCMASLPPNSLFNPNPYWNIIDLCDDKPNPDGSLVPSHDFNEGSISTLTNLVPTPYLRVSPLNDLEYVLPINGSPTPSQTTYTATASSSETVPTTVSAYSTTPPPGEPAFLQVGGYNTSLAPGGSTTISVTASVPTGTPCGVYDRYVTVADLTHNFGDKMRHRFEIGMTDFTVTPEGASDIYGITAPSSPESISYTLTNTRPTAVTVVASVNQSWLSIDPASSNSVNLAPAGQPGATKTIAVKPTAAAYSLSNGDYPFAVSFEGQGGCQLNNPVVRSGAFHKGVIVLKKTLNALVFPPTPPNAPVTDTFALTSTFCVSDVKVRFNSEVAGAAAGVPWASWAPSVRIYLDLAGTQNVSSQLWNLNALPWNAPSNPGPNGSTIETLQLDRTQNVPPVGAASLSIFNNKNAAGQWSFRLFDDGIQAVNTGILESWELELRGSRFCISPGS